MQVSNPLVHHPGQIRPLYLKTKKLIQIPHLINTTMNRLLVPLTLMTLLTGCFLTRPVKPVATNAPENNQDYKVDYLFEFEGCKVYRFYDRGNYVYYTNCSNQAITVTDSTQVINSMRPPPR